MDWCIYDNLCVTKIKYIMYKVQDSIQERFSPGIWTHRFTKTRCSTYKTSVKVPLFLFLYFVFIKVPVSSKINVIRIVSVPTNIASTFLYNVNIKLPPTSCIHHRHFAQLFAFQALHACYRKSCTDLKHISRSTKSAEYAHLLHFIFYLIPNSQSETFIFFFSHTIVDLAIVRCPDL